MIPLRTPAIALLLASLAPAPARAEFTLGDAWTAAEAGNIELKQAQARSEEASALRLEALSMQLAHVSTQWTAAFNDQEIVVPPELLVGVAAGLGAVLPLQTRQAYGGSVTLTQPLLRAPVIPAVRAATRAWRAARADEGRARQQVRAAAARAYWGLLSARAGRDVARKNVGLAEAQQELSQRSANAGLGGQRAILQARLGVSRARRELLAGSEAVGLAEGAWRAALGREPRDDLVTPAPPEVPATLDEALARARTGRSDLEAAGLRWGALRGQRAATDLEWAPTLDLAVQARFNLSPTLLNPVPAQAGLGIQLNWEVFDGGRRVARSQKLQARARLARLGAERLLRDAEQEVRAAWQHLARAASAVLAVEAEVSLAEEDLALAQRGLDSGANTLFDVQGAQLSAASARLARIRETTARDLAAVDLLLAMGAL